MTPQGRPRLLVLVSEMPRQPEEWYVHGVKVITMRNRRVLPGAKSINYLSATLALKEAQARGAVESVYVDRGGLVYEGTTSNIFMFSGDMLVTPGRRILAGITRGFILELAQKRFQIDVRDLSLKELLRADEIFLTGTNKGVVPVVQVDEHQIGDGRPGRRTQALWQAMGDHAATCASRTVYTA
jgi:branched-chain amino acid aminotransferase